MIRITRLGTLKAERVTIGESMITLDGIKIDTFYGEQFAVNATLDEWKEFIENGGDPLEMIDDNQIFAEAIHWDGDPEDTQPDRADCPECAANIPNDGACWYCEQIPFLGELQDNQIEFNFYGLEPRG